MKAIVRVPFFKDFAYIEYEIDSEKDVGDQQDIVDVAVDIFNRTDVKNAKPTEVPAPVREHEHLPTNAAVPAQPVVYSGKAMAASKPFNKRNFKGPYVQAALSDEYPHSPKCKQCGNIISPGMQSYYDKTNKVRLCSNCYGLFAD